MKMNSICNIVPGCVNKGYAVVRHHNLLVCKLHRKNLLSFHNNFEFCEDAHTKINTDKEKVIRYKELILNYYGQESIKYMKHSKVPINFIGKFRALFVYMISQINRAIEKNTLTVFITRNIAPEVYLDGFSYDLSDYTQQFISIFLKVLKNNNILSYVLQFLESYVRRKQNNPKCCEIEGKMEFRKSFGLITEISKYPELINIIKFQVKHSQKWADLPIFISLQTPKSPGNNLNLAVSYMKLTEYTLSLSYFKSALKSQPNSAEILFYIGYCYFKLGEYLISIDFLSKSIETEAIDDRVRGLCYKYAAYSFARLKKVKPATKWLEKARDLGLECLDVKLCLLYAQGDSSQAIQMFKQNTLVEKYTEIYCLKATYPYIREIFIAYEIDLALCYIDSGQYEFAKEILNEVIRKTMKYCGYLNYLNSEALKALALILQKLGMHEESLDKLEKTLKIEHKIYKENSQRIVLTVVRMASVYMDMNNFAKTKEKLLTVYKFIDFESFCGHEISVLFGRVAQHNQNYFDAYVFYKIAIHREIKNTGLFHPVIAHLVVHMGDLFMLLGNSRALKSYKVALKIYRCKYELQHPFSESIIKKIKACYSH